MFMHFLFLFICTHNIFSNGVNVEGAEHRYVVELIKQGGDVLKLTVISVSRKVSVVEVDIC